MSVSIFLFLNLNLFNSLLMRFLIRLIHVLGIDAVGRETPNFCFPLPRPYPTPKGGH